MDARLKPIDFQKSPSHDMGIAGYGVCNASGDGVDAFWAELCSGGTIRPVAIGDQYCFKFQSKVKHQSQSAVILEKLEMSFQEAITMASSNDVHCLPAETAVIFTSTKGAIDDEIWSTDSAIETLGNLEHLFLQLLNQLDFNPAYHLTLSNACSSAMVALNIACELLHEFKQVIVVSGDICGDFVTKGFATLRSLSTVPPRPFAASRDGLMLGDGANTIIVTRPRYGLVNCRVQTLTEGYAATSTEGKALTACIESLQLAQAPALIIAHGTATPSNDRVEDSVYQTLNPRAITATKWSIGHSMAASSGMDIIAACEIVRRQQVFSIATTEAVDSAFSLQRNYLIGEPPLRPFKTEDSDEILVCSLGFGGVQAAAAISKSIKAQSLSSTPNLFPPSIRFAACYNPRSFAEEVLTIPRWNQFDESAKHLCNFGSELKKQQEIADIEAIILVTTTDSHRADLGFATSGAISPSRFVHTLPSVRLNPLLYLLDRQIPCFSICPHSNPILHGLKLAKYLLQPRLGCILVLTERPHDQWFAAVCVNSEPRCGVAIEELLQKHFNDGLILQNTTLNDLLARTGE